MEGSIDEAAGSFHPEPCAKQVAFRPRSCWIVRPTILGRHLACSVGCRALVLGLHLTLESRCAQGRPHSMPATGARAIPDEKHSQQKLVRNQRRKPFLSTPHQRWRSTALMQ